MEFHYQLYTTFTFTFLLAANNEVRTCESELRAYLARVHALDRSTSSRKNGNASLQAQTHIKDSDIYLHVTIYCLIYCVCSLYVIVLVLFH